MQTHLEIRQDAFYIDGKPTYEGVEWEGHRMEGLLLNSRMVQATFDDRNPQTLQRFAYPDTGRWDPRRNTREFIRALSEYRREGLLGVTVNWQGGHPVQPMYEDLKEQPWLNSALEEDGTLRPDGAERMAAVLDAADRLGMVVILGIFYFGQEYRLKNEAAVRRAVDQTLDWLFQHGWTNLLIEINNECDVHYRLPLLRPEGVHELIQHVASQVRDGRRFLAGTSYGGGVLPKENVVRASDFLLLHGNGVEDPARISEMVRQTRLLPGYRPMPILFNEDDHFGFDKPDCNMKAAVREYASWGYFDPGTGNYQDGYQCPPVQWGLNTARKRGFFATVREMTGA